MHAFISTMGLAMIVITGWFRNIRKSTLGETSSDSEASSIQTDSPARREQRRTIVGEAVRCRRAPPRSSDSASGLRKAGGGGGVRGTKARDYSETGTEVEGDQRSRPRRTRAEDVCNKAFVHWDSDGLPHKSSAAT